MAFIAGDAEDATVERLCEMALREYSADPRRISCALYCAGSDGRLAPYHPPSHRGIATRVRLAHYQFIAAEYARQKAELDQLYAGQRMDLFGSPLKLIQPNDKPLTSVAFRAKGVDGILPEADVVAIQAEANRLAPWADVRAFAGGHFTPMPGLFPPRWRTDPETPASVWAQLCQLGEPL